MDFLTYSNSSFDSEIPDLSLYFPVCYLNDNVNTTGSDALSFENEYISTMTSEKSSQLNHTGDIEDTIFNQEIAELCNLDEFDTDYSYFKNDFFTNHNSNKVVAVELDAQVVYEQDEILRELGYSDDSIGNLIGESEVNFDFDLLSETTQISNTNIPSPQYNDSSPLFLNNEHLCTFSSDFQTVSSNLITGNDPVMCLTSERLKRRSLLYDKNEYIPNSSDKKVSFRNKHILTRKKTTLDEERTFICSVENCGKPYRKASHLKAHMRRHSGYKPFACDFDGCKWKFSRSDELARHKRSHTGYKPYVCEFCDKAFSRSDHLTKHIKVHNKRIVKYGTHIITKRRKL